MSRNERAEARVICGKQIVCETAGSRRQIRGDGRKGWVRWASIYLSGILRFGVRMPSPLPLVDTHPLEDCLFPVATANHPRRLPRCLPTGVFSVATTTWRPRGAFRVTRRCGPGAESKREAKHARWRIQPPPSSAGG